MLIPPCSGAQQTRSNTLFNPLASLVRSQSMQGSELNVVAFFMNVPEGDLSKWLADVGQEAALAWIIEHNDVETLAMFYETLRKVP